MFEHGLMDNETNLIERYRRSDGLPHRFVDDVAESYSQASDYHEYRAEVYKPNKYGRLKWQSIASGNDYIPIYLAFLDSLRKKA